MKRKKCKNHKTCKGYQTYTTRGLCKNCYIKERGFNTAAYKIAKKIIGKKNA